ncbi:MAG: radical SAM protein, partial [Candidatus Aminicenantes bacterium]|nr:radical SAM protein [Candidatus Aminicenantes bacterium]
EELLGLMKQAGCLFVFIGFESVNPRSLQAMKKEQTLAEMKAAVKLIRRHGIRVHGMFVYGFDEDDWVTVRKTVRFAKRFGLTSTQFLILTPLPGSEFYRKVKAEGRLLFKDWGLYDAHHVVFWPAKLSLRTLQKAQMFSHKKFYSLLQSGKRIFRLQLFEVVLAHYARNLNKMWKKKNRAFLKVLELLTSSKNSHIRIDYKQDAGLE